MAQSILKYGTIKAQVQNKELHKSKILYCLLLHQSERKKLLDRLTTVKSEILHTLSFG